MGRLFEEQTNKPKGVSKMRNNPNKVIKVITKKGEEYWCFLTGKLLSFYLLVFDISAREICVEHPNTSELHASGQTKAIRFFCDSKEIEEILDGKQGRKNG